MDTSVIIKSIFKPARSLPDEKYEREMATHKKCTYIIKTIEEHDIDTYIPYVCIVETAAVAKRLSDAAELCVILCDFHRKHAKVTMLGRFLRLYSMATNGFRICV